MISIIIPTCKSTNLIPCLQSIRRYTNSTDIEIIVVANGYDGEIPMGVIPIWHKDMIGYPAACNAGILQARGEFAVLLNDDTELLPQPIDQWLDILKEPFSDPDVAITGPWMMNNSEIQRDFLCFFCCMIRKSVLDQIGLLDVEAFGAGYGEDVDLSCRAVDAGFKILQVPTPAKVSYDGRMGLGAFPIFHSGNNTFQNWPGGVELLNRNHAILRERYGGIIITNAQKLGEWISTPELTWLAKTARKSKVVIELGSWLGKSSLAIADNLPHDGVLYCVDTWAGSQAELDTNHIAAKQMDGDYIYDGFCRNLWPHIASGKLRTIRMHGRHAAKLLKGMGVEADLVFIDAGHTYEEVKEDIYSFAPLVKEGGIMAGHDYGEQMPGNEAWPGVRQAVDELLTHFWREQWTSFWITDKPPIRTRHIYEGMMFNNEFEMLEKHLETMWDTVERFVITEATMSHSGQPKPLHFQNNLRRFERFLSKISYVLVEDSPAFDGTEKSTWEIEAHQRNAMMRALTHCDPDDIVIVADCDEIPNPETVKNFRGEVSSLLMDLYLFDRKVKAKEPWRHAKILPYWQLKLFTPTGARYLTDCPDVVKGGEHLSYCGGVEKIQEKLRNTAHLNVNSPEFLDPGHIQKCIDQGLDLFNRDIKYEVVK